MIRDLLFEPDARAYGRPSLWLTVAMGITVGYLVFGLIFLGVQPLSRGGIVFAAAGLLWSVFAIASGQARFPPVLALPFLYLVYIAVSGLQVDPYPSEYVLRLFTVWMGAMTVAFFVANGVSLYTVAGGLVLLCVANFIAVALGYETNFLNDEEFATSSLDAVDVARSSGLAGQTNKLVGVMFVLPFCVFLFKRRQSVLVYALMIAVCVGTALLTGSRSTLLFTPLFAACGALWILPRGPIRMVFLAGSLAGAMILVSLSADTGLVPRLQQTEIGQTVLFKRTLSAIDGDGSTEAREEFATGFGPYFAERPLVGYGAGTFGDVTGAGTYAHNNFAEISINGGVVGLLLYYAMYVAVAFGVLRTFPKQLALLAPLAFLAVADGVFVTQEARGMILLLCLLLVTTFGLRSPEREGQRRRRRRRRR